MRAVVALSALVLSGCGGWIHSANTAEAEARETPILRAAIDCDTEELRRRAPAEHTLRDKIGMGALHWALARGCDEGVVLLLAAGANPNDPTPGHWPPLASAASRGKLKLVRALLARGADVNSPSAGGTRPLHAAAAGGHASVMRFLIEHGADPQTRDDRGMTPLHMGARHGEIVRLLLKEGVNRDARNGHGATPLASAYRWVQHPVALAGGGGAKALLDAGADANASDKNGFTPLMQAVRACDEEMVRDLLNVGANVNARNITGSTALDLLRWDREQSGGFSQMFWSLFDSRLKAGMECRERMQDTLTAAGAK